MTARRVKVTVLLDADQFGQLDAYCRTKGFKKSTLIARLIRDHLTTERFAQQAELSLGNGGDERRQ